MPARKTKAKRAVTKKAEKAKKVVAKKKKVVTWTAQLIQSVV